MIVVDTSVLIGAFKGARTLAVERLKSLEEADAVLAIPYLCAQELLQGAKDEREWKLLATYLEPQELLGPSEPWKTHQRAARIFFDCRRRGLTVRSAVDCLIAQLVLDVRGTLLHDDEDFDRIARVRPLKTLRR